MPTTDGSGCEIKYERIAGDPDREPVVLVGELGFGAWQWGWQHAGLSGRETVVYDHRGTGRSATPPGPYTMADLVDDFEAVLRATNVRRAHVVGCGLGGCVALAAARRTGRVRSLTLLGTPVSGAGYDSSDIQADPADSSALRESTEALLSSAFCEAQPDVIDQIVEWRADEDASPTVQEAQKAAIEGFDAEPLYELTRPALVVAGGQGSVVDSAVSRRLAADLPRGEFQDYPDAGHLVGVERSAALNDRLVGFLQSVEE